MVGIAKVQHGVPAENVVRLKPQKLGRHYHKIPSYIRDLTSKHPRVLSDYFLRNYRIALELSRVEVHEVVARNAECFYRSSLGKVGFSIDRLLLAEVLECYYGGTYLPMQDAPPISTSEQRMRSRMGIDIAQLFARSILTGSTFGNLSDYDATYDVVEWEYIVEFKYLSHLSQNPASIYIYLDSQIVDELTTRITHPVLLAELGDPLAQIKELPLTLDCVIASLDMNLSQVLNLKLNDILMIRLQERCDVLINQQKVFRGAVFEDNGALFLTSVESVKNP
jgi:flagellar motor switch protein FliM